MKTQSRNELLDKAGDKSFSLMKQVNETEYECNESVNRRLIRFANGRQRQKKRVELETRGIQFRFQGSFKTNLRFVSGSCSLFPSHKRSTFLTFFYKYRYSLPCGFPSLSPGTIRFVPLPLFHFVGHKIYQPLLRATEDIVNLVNLCHVFFQNWHTRKKG